MKKRLFALALALCLCLGSLAPAAAAYSGYSDVPADHWAAGSIRRATELGLFQGVGGGRFGRGEPITRAAFVTALCRLFDWEMVVPERPTYSDVPARQWYYSAVETALLNGAVDGAQRTFRPTEHITREDMAVMIVRGLGYASLAGAVSSYSSPFTDVKTNKGYITIAYDTGIVSGVGDGLFAPDSTATREQAAVMLVRVYDKLHTSLYLQRSADGFTPVTVPTPQAQDKAQLPTTPLEPIGELYTTLRKLKESGSDMGKFILSLTAGGVQTITNSQGSVLSSEPIGVVEVVELLEQEGVRLYYSDRYESAYCIYRPNSYQSATVWYQNEKSLAAKLQLARLFGVTNYILNE